MPSWDTEKIWLGWDFVMFDANSPIGICERIFGEESICNELDFVKLIVG